MANLSPSKAFISLKRLAAESLVLAIIATVATLWLFSPVLKDWTTVTASSDHEIIPVNDSWQNVWMLWWTARAVMRF